MKARQNQWSFKALCAVQGCLRQGSDVLPLPCIWVAHTAAPSSTFLTQKCCSSVWYSHSPPSQQKGLSFVKQRPPMLRSRLHCCHASQRGTSQRYHQRLDSKLAQLGVALPQAPSQQLRLSFIMRRPPLLLSMCSGRSLALRIHPLPSERPYTAHSTSLTIREVLLYSNVKTAPKRKMPALLRVAGFEQDMPHLQGQLRRVPGPQKGAQSGPHENCAGVRARALHEANACAAIWPWRQPPPAYACNTPLAQSASSMQYCASCMQPFGYTMISALEMQEDDLQA